MNVAEQCPNCGKRKALRALRCRVCSEHVKRGRITDMCGTARTRDDQFHAHCSHFIGNAMRWQHKNEISHRKYCVCICHDGTPKPLDPDPKDIQALALKTRASLPPALKVLFEKAKLQKATVKELERPVVWDVPLHDLCEVGMHEECPANAKQCGCQCHAKAS